MSNFHNPNHIVTSMATEAFYYGNPMVPQANTLVPNVIEKTSNGERAYDLFSRLLKDRIIFLNGGIDDSVASIVVAQLLFLDAEDSEKPIYLYINSPGGSITAGMAIRDTMNFISAKVSTVCIGMAASMGAFLLSCGEPGMRYALPSSEVMIHQPLGGTGGHTQATDMKIITDRILKMREDLERIMAENSGVSIDQMHKDCERDNFLTAQEAADYGTKGLVDKVIEKASDLTAK